MSNITPFVYRYAPFSIRWLAVIAIVGMALFAMHGRPLPAVAQPGGLTAGAILDAPAAQYGWSLAETSTFSRTNVGIHQVIMVDNFDPQTNLDQMLDTIVAEMRERGARVIFVAPLPAAVSAPTAITAAYPDVVFIWNVGQREDVAVLLDSLAALVLDDNAVDGETDGASLSGSEGDAEESDSSAASELSSTTLFLMVALIAVSIMLFVWWRSINLTGAGESKHKRRKWSAGNAGVHTRALAIERAVAVRQTDFRAMRESTPLLHDLSTYVRGDRAFDESSGVETETNEYLGQCGVSRAKRANPYEPEKTAAVEVWLFDKHDINTVSFLLVSQHTYHDPELRAKLAEKHELVLAEEDAEMFLQTKTLRLRARVLDVQHGYDPNLPPGSFFEYIVVEVAVWQR
ncbi:MAG: hypothetical protein GYB65_17475 [Chloroflexi bacterium]|nr:hypothetical protein [Chloroflexota bacterium]